MLVLALAWVLFVPAADWLAHQDVGSAKGPLLQTARDTARGRLLTLGAGLLAAAVLVFAARALVLLRRGQVTDRYTKAIEQLGSMSSMYGSAASTPWRASPATRPEITRW